MFPIKMNKILIIIAIAIIFMTGRSCFTSESGKPVPAKQMKKPSPATVEKKNEQEIRFQCDGRVHCSEMTSCEEARYFLRNCPGVKMDGDGDGVPCERQWCR